MIWFKASIPLSNQASIISIANLLEKGSRINEVILRGKDENGKAIFYYRAESLKSYSTLWVISHLAEPIDGAPDLDKCQPIFGML
jgi:hypothetical protein